MTYDPALLNPAALHLKAPDEFQVKFTTTKGDFVVKVTRGWAPLGVDRFYTLVKHHYFDNASFFRVVPNFVVQFGMSAFPPVTKAWSKVPIKDDAVKTHNKVGTITFATSGTNTRTTQLFINLRDNTDSLDNQGFAPFGEVVEGMDVVTRLYSGYGDGPPYGAGPDQGQIQEQGKVYLDKNFPQLDSVKTAVVVAPPKAKP